MLKKIAIAVVLAISLAIGAGNSAEAGGGHRGGGHHWGNKGFSGQHHWRHYRPRHPIYVEAYGCQRYYHRWMNSGRFYWKKKYYLCKGWW